MKTNKGKQAHVPSNDSDELNPDFLFSITPTELLVAIASGRLDARELAIEALRGRGQDLTDGTWVGFMEINRYEYILNKHQLMLKPTQVIQQELGIYADKVTDTELAVIRNLFELIKEEKFCQAIELALISGDTIKSCFLTKLKR